VRLEGNTTIVPVVEEVVMIEKVLVLVEEIHVSRHSVAEEAQLPVTRRVERASVAREPDLEQVVE
jgi:stress response protein YsnF